MNQLTLLLEEHPVSLSQSQDLEKDWKIQEETSPSLMLDFLTTLNPNGSFGKMCQVSSVPITDKTFQPSSQRWLTSGMGSPTECLMLNTSEYPNEGVESLLLDVLEVGNIPPRFFLSQVACQGILRRAEKRGKKLPPMLEKALRMVAVTPTSATP